jgi:hypothetical protein
MSQTNITQELKNTLIQYPNIETVYFDRLGNHHFSVYKHKDTGDFYTRIKDLNVKVIEKENGVSVQKQRRIYEANANDKIVQILPAKDVLAMPVLMEKPVMSNKETEILFEKQAQQFAAVTAELEELRKKAQENEELKEKLQKLEEEKSIMEQMISEDKSSADKKKK